MVSGRIGGRLKAQLKLKVTFVLMGLVTLFVWVFVPTEVLGPLLATSKDWAAVASKVGGSVSFASVVSWIVFAQDHLAFGGSAASRFYRASLPSRVAVEKFGKTTDEANWLWFNLFNGWEAPDHPKHAYYKINLQRSYALRLIFYLKRVCAWFLVAGLGMLGLDWWLRTSGWRTLLLTRVAFLAAAAIVLTWLQLSNRFRLSKSGGDEATGAYGKFREISGILRCELESAMLCRDIALPRPTETIASRSKPEPVASA